MHTITIQTKFRFGDLVEFDSKLNGWSGVGKVFAVTIDVHGHKDYMVDVSTDGFVDVRPGIEECEMKLLTERRPTP
jgi:hypothetical protein